MMIFNNDSSILEYFTKELFPSGNSSDFIVVSDDSVVNMTEKTKIEKTLRVPLFTHHLIESDVMVFGSPEYNEVLIFSVQRMH